ncbi:MAG: hypothetical protein RL708_2214 [Bacteroidota bacterium]|jgi:hypothetical protein
MSKNIHSNQEHEQNKHVLHFTINGKSYALHHEYITGAEIKQLASIPVEDDLFLAVKKPWEDELISDETKVNLARPEAEHFYSKEKNCEIILVVNGKQKSWKEKTISFEQVVVLAFESYDSNPNKVYTVTYANGPQQNPEGSMIRGAVVFVKNKMVFNVSASDKS